MASIRTLSSVCWMCVSCRLVEIYIFVDKDQYTRKSELSVGACYLARYRCRGVGAKKISLVNEVQCGTGTEWRDLIGQQTLGKPMEF